MNYDLCSGTCIKKSGIYSVAMFQKSRMRMRSGFLPIHCSACPFLLYNFRLKWVPTNGKWFVGIPFKTLKSHRQSSIREESLWDFLCRTHERTGNIRASRASVSVKEMRFHLLLSAPTIGSHIRSIRYSANLLRHRISDSQLLHRPDCK